MNPYRKPCGGGRERQWPWKSGCFQQKRRADMRVQKYRNVTVVPNPTCPDSWDPSFTPPDWPPLVAPYTRPNCAEPEPQPGRSGYPGDAGYCDPGHPNQLPCGPWLKSQLGNCVGGATTIDLNCYSIVPGEYLDLSDCRKIGFKNVQARHWWYGRFGFEDTDASQHGSPAPGCDLPIPSNPSGVKYRTVHIFASYGQTNPDLPDTEFYYQYDRTFSIDRRSGVITQSGAGVSFSGPASDPGAGPGTPIAYVIDNANGMGQILCAAGYDGDWIFSLSDDSNAPIHTEIVSTYERSNTHVKRTLTYTSTGPEAGDDSVQTHIFEATLSDESYASDLVHEVVGLLEEWDLADDRTYPWRRDAYTTVAPLVQFNGVPDDIGPLDGAPNSNTGLGPDDNGWTDINADRYDGQIIGSPLPWPGAVFITQDAGFTTDSFGPSITSYLASTGIVPGTVLQLAHTRVTVVSVKLYDGDTLLAAGVQGTDFVYDPAFGTVTILADSNLIIDNSLSTNLVFVDYNYAVEEGGHFDWSHETWRWSDPALGGPGPYLFGYGAVSAGGLRMDPTDYYVPRTATHWTQNNEAQNLPHGAWQIYEGGLLWLQKWAEIKVPRPSQNYFGPCGVQRYEIDASHSSCVESAGGDPLVITVKTGEGTRFSADDQVIYWDGLAAGVYTVAGVSGDDVTLAKVADSPPFTGGPILGKLRWPDAWAICGRARIASIEQNLDEDDEPDGTMTATMGEPVTYLRAGDQVDLTHQDATHPQLIDYSAISVLAVTSPTEFTIADTGISDPDLPTHIKSAGAPGYWWYDVRPKGDFVFLKWGWNYREIAIDPGVRANQASHSVDQAINAFFATTGCVPADICWPQVMCISPNANPLDEYSVDYFPAGQTFDFDLITIDDRFGARWQAIIQQVMDDIFWAAPYKPCSDPEDEFGDYSGCAQAEDDGTCKEDTCVGVGDGGSFIYAHRPLVEARAALPIPWLLGDTTPTLPDGVLFGYLTLADLDTVDEPDGVFPVPPNPVGTAPGTLYQPSPPSPTLCPWDLYNAQRACVCANGRFAAEYKQNGVIC